MFTFFTDGDKLTLFSGSIHQDTELNNAKVVWSSKNRNNSNSRNRNVSSDRLQNDFDPFRRLPSQPFGRRGRSLSVDSNVRSRRRSLSLIKRPNLPTIMEEFGEDIESIFEWSFEIIFSSIPLQDVNISNKQKKNKILIYFFYILFWNTKTTQRFLGYETIFGWK